MSRTTAHFLCLGAAFVACAASAASPAPTSPQLIAIVNARLETVSDGVIETGTLVLDQGRIAAIGRSVPVPRGARVIDAAGTTVTPGFIAPSSNLMVAEVNLVVPTRDDASGERVSAGFDVQYGVNPASIAVPVARLSGITHAVITPLVGRINIGAGEDDAEALQGAGEGAGSHPALFAGQAAIVRLAHGDSQPVIRARTAVALDLGEAGAQNAGGSRGAELVLVRAALADARHLAAHRAENDRDATRAYGLSRVDLEALVPVVQRRTPLLIRVSRASDILQSLELAREEKVRIILEGAEEGWLVADRIAAASVPVLLDPQADLPRSFEVLGARLDNAARLQRAGVLIAIKGGRNFNSLRPQRLNAGTAVAYGLTHAQALAAITLNPARIWGLEDSIGSLEVGKNADLVIWSGDPLETLSHPVGVFIGGVEQPLSSRRTQLRDRYLAPDEGYPPAYR
ncbi:MAG TPA: amidohydrolase family protein [Steroidobacteraceae bacterium]|nr:amidohydrolase family protein [Steroidobacteraceae bacterium]